jgi:hypothetical protein
VTLFAGLVDDAGLFPPEELPMAAALARHREDATAGSPVLTGRFLCTAARLPELLGHLAPEDHLALGLISPLDDASLEQSLAAIAAEPRIELAVVEGPARNLDALPTIPDGVPCHVETPHGDLAAVERVGAAGYGVKVRCGGVRAELFPSADELGAFIATCVRAGVPFKATAGLHHALPYRDARTGFSHHGFLNLLLATCRAVDGASEAKVVDAIASTDRDALVSEAQAVDAELANDARRLFVAYGSCSTREPIDDLRELGLLDS